MLIITREKAIKQNLIPLTYPVYPQNKFFNFYQDEVNRINSDPTRTARLVAISNKCNKYNQYEVWVNPII